MSLRGDVRRKGRSGCEDRGKGRSGGEGLGLRERVTQREEIRGKGCSWCEDKSEGNALRGESRVRMKVEKEGARVRVDVG